MILTDEIRDILAAGSEIVKEIELTYRNGGKVRGTIRKFSARRGKLSIQKSQPAEGERPRHKAVFDHVTALRMVLSDGTTREFN